MSSKFVTVTCPFCGSEVEVNLRRGTAYCGACGELVELEEQAEEPKRILPLGAAGRRLAARAGDDGTLQMDPSTLAIAVTFPAIIIIAVILLSYAGFFARIMPVREGYAVMPTSSDGFAGQLLTNVIETLEDAGFTNVKSKGENEFYMLRLKGEVHSVEVNGVQVSGGTQYKKDVEIWVKYYE